MIDRIYEWLTEYFLLPTFFLCRYWERWAATFNEFRPEGGSHERLWRLPVRG